MKEKDRRFHIAIIGILLISEVLSVISLWHYIRYSLGYQTGPSFCNINIALNCDAVTASAYSTLLGIPIAGLGILFYLVMFLLSWAALFRNDRVSVRKINQILFILASWSVLYSVYLFLISKFVIRTICPTCLAMYCCNIGLLYCAIRLLPDYSLSIFGESLSSGQYFLRLLLSRKEKAPPALLARRLTLLFLLAAFTVLSLPWAAHRLAGERSSVANEEKEAANLIEQWDAQKPVSFTFEKEGFRRDHTKGNPFAPVVLVEFSDFECPFCRKSAFDLSELLSDFDDQMEIVFKNFPLDKSCNSKVQRDMHRNSCFLAELARCAGEQDRFWDMSDYLMSLREGLDTRTRRELIKDSIKALDLDGVGLTECMNSGRQLEKVRSDILEGISLGIDHTPTLFINGRQVDAKERGVLRELIKHIVK